jgi:hypothetical protein
MPRDSMNVDRSRISGLSGLGSPAVLAARGWPIGDRNAVDQGHANPGLCEQWCCFTAKTDRLAETAQCDGLVVSAAAAVVRKNYQRGFLGLGASGVRQERFGQ